MKRVLHCTIILIVLAGMSIFTLFTLSKTCTAISDQAEKVLTISESGDKEALLLEADNLTELWDNSYKRLFSLVEQQKLYDIHNAIARIKPFIQSDSDELSAELSQIILQIKLVKMSEYPYLYNIF